MSKNCCLVDCRQVAFSVRLRPSRHFDDRQRHLTDGNKRRKPQGRLRIFFKCANHVFMNINEKFTFAALNLVYLRKFNKNQ